jgi:hypothetical protein
MKERSNSDAAPHSLVNRGRERLCEDVGQLVMGRHVVDFDDLVLE